MRDFKDLIVWQTSHKIALDIYRITKSFPKDELYGLTSKFRRSSVSIAANIAEGCGKNGDIEIARFFQISMGSACETEYYLILSKDLAFISEEDFKLILEKIIEVKKMLSKFIIKLRSG